MEETSIVRRILKKKKTPLSNIPRKVKEDENCNRMLFFFLRGMGIEFVEIRKITEIRKKSECLRKYKNILQKKKKEY